MENNSRDIQLEKQLDAYIKGRLSEEEVTRLWVALLKNPEYIDLLETEIAVKQIVEENNRAERRQGAGVTPINQNSLQRSWKWVAAAASVVILVIAINLLKVDSDQTLQQLALSEINMAQNLSSAEVLRAQKGVLSSSDSLLNVGFKAALSGKISRALELYEEVVANYKDVPAVSQAYLNIGIIQYNSGKYILASEAFKSALSEAKDEPLLQEKAYWYLGNAFINLDMLPRARAAIHSAYALNGIYRKPAFRLLRKLDYELGNIDFDNFDEQIKEE